MKNLIILIGQFIDKNKMQNIVVKKNNESRKVGLGTTVEYTERKFKTKA